MCHNPFCTTPYCLGCQEDPSVSDGWRWPGWYVVIALLIEAIVVELVCLTR